MINSLYKKPLRWVISFLVLSGISVASPLSASVIPVCGNNVAELGEECDGSINCSASCQLVSPSVLCGNFTLDPGEACDHGPYGSARCQKDCTVAVCGDKKIGDTEECDGGSQTTTICLSTCKYSQCGDSLLNPLAGEECDVGLQTVDCTSTCKKSTCGDGYRNVAAGEDCDDGIDNGTSQSLCSSTCKELQPSTATDNTIWAAIGISWSVVFVLQGAWYMHTALEKAMPCLLHCRQWCCPIKPVASVVAAGVVAATTAMTTEAEMSEVNGGSSSV